MSLTFGSSPVSSVQAEENEERGGFTSEELRQLRALRVLGGQWSVAMATKTDVAGASGTARPPAADAKTNKRGDNGFSSSLEQIGTSAVAYSHDRELQLHNQQLAAEALTSHQIQSELVQNGVTADQTASRGPGAVNLQDVAAALRWQQSEPEFQAQSSYGVTPFFISAVNVTPIVAYTPFEANDSSNGGTRISRIAAIDGLENTTIEARA